MGHSKCHWFITSANPCKVPGRHDYFLNIFYRQRMFLLLDENFPRFVVVLLSDGQRRILLSFFPTFILFSRRTGLETLCVCTVVPMTFPVCPNNSLRAHSIASRVLCISACAMFTSLSSFEFFRFIQILVPVTGIADEIHLLRFLRNS